MSLIRIGGRACEFNYPGSFTVVYDGKPGAYEKIADVKNVAEVEAAVEEAKRALMGGDYAIVAYFLKGQRAPRGAKRFLESKRSTFFVKKSAA